MQTFSAFQIAVAISALALGSTLAAAQLVLPAQTPIEVRLTERVSTHLSKKGSVVHAVIAAPVFAGDGIVVPMGSKVEGRVVHVNSVGLGFTHETSSIGLDMERIILPDGTIIPLAARVAQIENSREVINKQGRIAGVRSTSTLSHKTSGAVGTLAFSNPIALIFTTASSASLLRFSDPEISLPANTELILLTTQPLSIAHGTESAAPPLAQDAASERALTGLVRRQPYRTVTDPKHIPSDLTNLMFIGEQSAILRAFEAAGWLEVDALDAMSAYRTVRAISEVQAYRTAPMSTLLLEGQKPALSLAKTLDTFSKRHHLRVFATQDQWQGQRVWLSSSTQDIGIGFSASQKNFIHQIDHNIDHERAKVVNDLMLTGCVTGLNLVARSWLPKDIKNGTGEEIVTDDRMAVVRLNDCEAPLNVPAVNQTAAMPIHQNKFVQATRQTTLTLRNTILRDNLAVTAYGGIRMGLGLKHPKPPEQPLEVSSEINAHRYAIGKAEATAEDKPELLKRDIVETAKVGTTADINLNPPKRLPPYSVEIGVHGGFAGYAGGNGGAVGYLALPDDPTNNPPYLLVLGNEHHSGFNLGGSVTLDSHEHLSHEFSFDYNHTGFMLAFADLNLVPGPDTDPTTQSDFTFEEATLSTTEVAYNLQYLPLRRESRWRPYVSAGPSLRLMHLTEAPITRASPWFKLGLSTVGAITAAYRFASIPPLEGGGIFQVGLQYGGGVKYRASRRILLRADYKETLTAQPDFWSKSKDDIFSPGDLPGYSLTVVGPVMDGVMRQQRATMGVSFVF
ncbi:Outer membrane protein beta-barrel domain-containing protein [Terriglobus roseus]|uniref:Outer membrane protein beta-barrel domain-containing protein n=1 Tax=Terriglobus roseus TaxID=392734 RepID=A0A1H4N2T9_9BACT|nr:Outer membrane protein beta-barrel domain-containing protein [Terriglobus roseus]